MFQRLFDFSKTIFNDSEFLSILLQELVAWVTFINSNRRIPNYLNVLEFLADYEKKKDSTGNEKKNIFFLIVCLYFGQIFLTSGKIFLPPPPINRSKSGGYCVISKNDYFHKFLVFFT